MLMIITPAHTRAFFAASRDANPLHHDAAYAQRSQYGKPIVYGMAAVLYSLGQWSAGKPFKLVSLRADFRKPLFTGDLYELQITTARNGHRIRIGKGPVDYALISFVAGPWQPDAVEPSNPPVPAFTPRAAAASEPQTLARTLRYGVLNNELHDLQQTFGIVPGNMPASQLAAIVWASYHVGMEMPGRQALFAEIRFEFSNEASGNSRLELDLDAAAYDDRFNRYTLTGRGTGISRLSIAAFKRPMPVDFPLSAMPALCSGEQPLKGKTVFISGATRGFGAAMSRTCSLAGAQVAINYRGDAAAALSLRDELINAGGQAGIFGANLENPQSVTDMSAKIASSLGALDLIINNAAPPIREIQFLEQSNAEVLEFVRQNLRITLETARQMIPLLRAGGQFVHISTQYLTKPVRGFSHYLTAKAAQEGLIRALAEEYRAIDFVVVRLPRILTDQTNLPFSFSPPSQPWVVARAILDKLGSPGVENFRLIDLSEP